MQDSTPENATAAAQRGHESAELDTSYIGWFTAVFVVLLIGTAISAFAMLGGFRVPRPPTAAAPRAEAPTGARLPALQSAPAGELYAYRRDKAKMLEGYAWVDRAGGIVQIPIDRAMQLMVERSAPGPASPADAEQSR